MKAVVATFNQEKALVGAFSVITNLWMKIFEALNTRHPASHHPMSRPAQQHNVSLEVVFGLALTQIIDVVRRDPALNCLHKYPTLFTVSP